MWPEFQFVGFESCTFYSEIWRIYFWLPLLPVLATGDLSYFISFFFWCFQVVFVCYINLFLYIFPLSLSMGHFYWPWHDVSIRPSDVSFMWAHWLPDSRVCWWFVRHSGICLVLVCFRRISPLRHFWYFVGSWGEYELLANASIASLLVFEVSAVYKIHIKGQNYENGWTVITKTRFKRRTTAVPN